MRNSFVALIAAAVCGSSFAEPRTGENAALLLADEPAGRESRESYSLNISPPGAEIESN